MLLVNPWSTCHGGTAMVLLEFLRHLDRQFFDPLVLCPEPGPLPDRVRAMGVTVHTHSLSGLTRNAPVRFLRDSLWIRRLLRRERIDLVHMNGAKWRSSVALAARWGQIPYVVHLHNPARHAKNNFTLRWARRILAVSDAIAKPLLCDPRLGA